MALSKIDSSSVNGLGYGFKNRIINGAMVVDQRNAGALIAAGWGGYPVDRFSAFTTGITSATISTQQVSDAPAGFSKSLKLTVTAAGTAYGAGGRAGVYQRIEGYNVADLDFGLSSAATVTLSFWVKASITGMYSASIGNGASDRSYPFSFTINNANTWEQKTVTIAGDQSGTWLKDNGRGIVVEWCLGAESAKLGTANAWASAWYTGVTGTTALINTLNATWQITGVQLEKGTVATSFDYRPYGTELALCQRYYQKSYQYSAVPQTNYQNSCDKIGGVIVNIGTSTSIVGYASLGSVQYPVQMRAAPTVSTYAADGQANKVSGTYCAGVTYTSSTTPYGLGTSGFYLADSGGGISVTQSGSLVFWWVANAEL